MRLVTLCLLQNMEENKKSASSLYKIGDFVEIIVLNSRYHQIGKVVGFDPNNEFNLKIEFEKGYIQGYMVSEIRHIPRIGQKIKPQNKKSSLRKLLGT